ncbi:MAG: hypothetical protein GC191_20020 [Azospirillum sp.]|nr:hypothetical protein [Azospirillum sp.]
MRPPKVIFWANQQVIPGYRFEIKGNGRIEIWSAGHPPRPVYVGPSMDYARDRQTEEVARLTVGADSPES